MEALTWDRANSASYLKCATPSDNKYTRGVVTFISGSRKYPGAALLNTRAALACGVGMVRYLGPKSVKKLILLSTPQVVTTPGRTDAFVLGSGLPNRGSYLTSQKIKLAIKRKIPTVLDAGAIRFATKSHKTTVITPHHGELKQLLTSIGIKSNVADIASAPDKWARLTAEKLNLTVLLKGNTTYIANASQVIQLPASPPQLATAGTGDILAGILGALLAINKDVVTDENLIEIAATGALVHSSAAISAISKSTSGALNLNHIFEAISASIDSLRN